MTKELTISKVRLLFKKIIFHSLMAVLGLRCGVKAFSSCGAPALHCSAFSCCRAGL